ncbi:MAG: hypothetical protein WCH09_06215 [Bacteroidota bacterium]
MKPKLLILILTASLNIAWAQSFEVVVPAKSNIYFAGADVTASYAGDTILNATPLEVAIQDILGLTNQAISFYAQAKWDLDPNGAGQVADGNGALRSIGPVFGIGQVTSRPMGLIGVFVDDRPYKQRGSAPANLGYTRTNEVVSPKLYQPFYIGSGTNTSGEAMKFIMPAGTKRLFLGADDFGSYNNVGFAKVLVNLEGQYPPLPRKSIASADVVNGFVVGVNILDAGAGYDFPPVVLLVGGGGTGATAIATVAKGFLTSVRIVSPGSGYTSAPTVRIASPPFSPRLSVDVARIRVRLEVVLGNKYQVESSANLQTWSAAGDVFIAQDEVLQQEFDVDVTGKYFRIKSAP